MATMVMDTVTMGVTQKLTKYLGLLSLMVHTLSLQAGEWVFDPSLMLDQTYSDNVALDRTNAVGSFVNQSTFGINSTFKSRLTDFSFNSSNTYVVYSYDRNADNDYRTLDTNLRYALWTNGPALISSARITNLSRNSTVNSLADLVSGDTVEVKDYQAGIEYNRSNSKFSLESSLQYIIRQSDDNIGDSNGYFAIIDSRNGSSARNFLWQLKGNYSEQKNNGFSGRIYNVEALAGMITSSGISPFIRFFNEDSTGSISGSRNTGTSSLGPGVRWRISSHFFLDLSYNYSADKTKSDDYLASAINWQPSARTSLEASYNQRFFGNSYDFKFQHKIKRLTNNITYSEEIKAFDRNTYQQVALGDFWCPVGADTSTDISACFIGSNTSIDFDNFQLISLFDQVLVAGNEFSLYKTLSWQTELNLARTKFSFTASSNERESLTTSRIDKYLNASISATRTISAKSELKFIFDFRYRQFDSVNTEGNGQKDYYRTFSSTYKRNLASSLTSNVILQYLDRSSTNVSYTYNELRAIINIKKEF